MIRNEIPLTIGLISALILAVVVLIIFFNVAADRGDATRNNLKACHAKGAQYHYWQEREKCVLYVNLDSK